MPIQWSSAKRFVRRAATPARRGYDILQIVILTISFVAFVGFGFLQPWVWVAATSLVAALAIVAGVRLQMELDARNEPRFRISPQYSASPGSVMVGPKGPRYDDNTSLWVRVQNDGPPAEFAARILNVKGVQHSGPYEVPELAWEHAVENRYRIERGGSSRLRVGNAARTENDATRKVLWFYTAKSATWSGDKHAAGLRLSHNDRVTFDLEVVNTAFDVVQKYRLLLTFEDDGSVADFRLM